MDPKQELARLTEKKHIFFTEKGNSAIKKALEIAKEKGKTKVLIQDQGGWLTYLQFPKKIGLETIEIKTDNGFIDIKNLEENADDSCILLLNSMPGYHAYEDTQIIEQVCQKNGVYLINDVSGSIGTEHAKRGNLILGSFGRWKPLSIEKGGFIASNEEIPGEENILSQEELTQLSIKLKKLPERIQTLIKKQARIKEDLKNQAIVHPSAKGFNVIVRFVNEEGKKGLINYAEKNNIPYTICPRYIRILDNAVSFEVKRHEEKSRII